MHASLFPWEQWCSKQCWAIKKLNEKKKRTDRGLSPALIQNMTSGKICLKEKWWICSSGPGKWGVMARVQRGEGKLAETEHVLWTCKVRTCYPRGAAQDLYDPLQGERVKFPCSWKAGALPWVSCKHSGSSNPHKLASYTASLRNYLHRPGCSHSESHLPLPPCCWDRKWMPPHLALVSCYCENISNCLELLVKRFT